jgi:hypothetical protein
MADHADRSHSTWSASATARRAYCLGSLVMEAQVPGEDNESIHSARGTAAHTVAETCLRDGSDAIDHLGIVVKTKKFEIEIDEELVTSAQAFIDYVRGRLAKYKAETGRDDAILVVEQQFSLNELGTPFDAGGTGDAVMYFPAWRLLEIADLKNGRGYVSEKENMQLRTYGVGGLLANPQYEVDAVRTTIVQPRLPGHDPVRSETISTGELISWTAELLGTMQKAKQAEVEFEKANGNSVLFDEWADKWLKAGNCTFCKRDGNCPKQRTEALAVAGTWFEPDTGEARIGNLPTEMSPEKLGETLDLLPMLEDWIKATRAYAHTQAENGMVIPTPDGERYHLVDKIGFRKWKADESATAVSLLSLAGLSEDEIYDRKLKSAKVLGAKRKNLADDLWEKPVTGTNLVRSDKTTRPATKSKVETYFESNKDQ